MKKGLTEVVFIMDKSGSMHGLEADTIGGYNSFLENQREVEGDCLISTVLFSHNSTVIHDRIPLEKVEPMTDAQYKAGGNTALLDAIGNAVHHIGNIHKYAREENIPEKTIFVITTDGMENSSHKYSYAKIKNMIERQTEKYGWEFLFLGANIDAITEGARLGIREDRSVTYRCDSEGLGINNRAVFEAVTTIRKHEVLTDSWKSEIEEYLSRR